MKSHSGITRCGLYELISITYHRPFRHAGDGAAVPLRGASLVSHRVNESDGVWVLLGIHSSITVGQGAFRRSRPLLVYGRQWRHVRSLNYSFPIWICWSPENYVLEIAFELVGDHLFAFGPEVVYSALRAYWWRPSIDLIHGSLFSEILIISIMKKKRKSSRRREIACHLQTEALDRTVGIIVQARNII